MKEPNTPVEKLDSIATKRNSNLRVYVALVLLALVIRIVWVLLAPRVDPIIKRDPLYGDAQGYELLATNLLQGLGLTWDGQTPTSYRMPGYPLFLALAYTLAGRNLEAVRFSQAVLGALTCIPVIAIASLTSKRRVVVLTGLGMAFYPLLIYMTGWLYSETLFLLLLWVGLFMILRMREDSSLWHALQAGILFGLATYVRPEIAFLPIFILFVGLLLRWHRKHLVLMLVVQATLILVVLPWSLRNRIVHDKLVLLTTNTGVNLYRGNNDMATGGASREVPYVLTDLSEVESNQEFMQKGFEWIRGHPVEFLSLIPAKLSRLFSPMEMAESPKANFLGRWELAITLVYWGFILLSVLGCIVGWKKEVVKILLLLVGWYSLITIVFYGGTRFSMPIIPALIILAALGLDRLWTLKKI